jgi:hypothetical protein
LGGGWLGRFVEGIPRMVWWLVGMGGREGKGTYTPGGRFALVDVEVDTLEFGPERILHPDIRVDSYRYSYPSISLLPKQL